MKHKILELRAQGAQIDAAARAAPPRRHLETVPEATSAVKPLGLVWVLSPSYSITTEGLKKVLEGKADVRIGGESPTGSPSCVVLYAAGGMEEGCLRAWEAFVNAILACRCWSSVRSWILGWPGPR
jgi:hypothetical protein